MKVFTVIFGMGFALALLVPSAIAQELRLDLARKRQEVIRPALDPKTVVREAEQAVREFQEQVGRERIIKESQAREPRPDLDPVITRQKQTLAVDQALRGFRR